MNPQALPTSKSSGISYILNAIFGVILGLLLFRMFLGKMPVEPSIYVRYIWVILSPVILLRHLDNFIVYVVLYAVLWIYIALRRIFIHRDPPFRIIMWTILWMIIIVIPFILVGYEFFSLFEYRLRYSYLMQRIPFILLFVVVLFSNLCYFKQKFIKAFIWTVNITGMIIVLLTVAHFLPLHVSHRDLHFSSFRIAFLNNLITKTPIIALFLFLVIGVCGLFIIERYFILQKRMQNRREIIFMPVLFIIILIIFSSILYSDYMRYKPIAYGNSTCIDWNKYPDRQFIWLDPARIKISPASVTMFYPYGDFDLTDTLRRHAKDLGHMKIIEGVNKYRLQRIFEILANGPRDSVVYKSLRNIIQDNGYKMPRRLREITSDIRKRFSDNKSEITVTGWIMHNGKPLSSVDFCVNKWIRSIPESFERVWKAKTDMTGKFEFNCYKGESPHILYFHMYFLPSDTIMGWGIQYLKITNLPPFFSEPGNYILDTVKIETKRTQGNQSLWTVNIYPRSPLDSFEIWLPAISESLGVRITAEILESGKIKIEKIDIGWWEKILKSKKTKNEIMKKVNIWRFFTTEEDKRIEVYINSDAGPRL